MLIWLAWYTLKQDQAIVDQRIQERLDSTADVITVALQNKFSDVGEHLADLASSDDINLAKAIGLNIDQIGNDALIALVEPGKLEAFPRGNLRYYPILPSTVEGNSEIFAQGENDEFRRKDFMSAAAVYENLASSANATTRAGALVRLGRVLRRADNPQRALAVYRELAESGIESVDGLPAEILARYARCVLLDELKQVPELQKEAQIIWSGLQLSKWPLTSSAYRFYEKESLLWLGLDQLSPETHSAQLGGALSLTVGVEELWRLWQRIQQGVARPTGERNLSVEGSSVFLMWRGDQNQLIALIARPGFLEKE